MKKFFLSTVLSLVVVCLGFSQHQITGKVLDDQQQAVDYANILLLNPLDSSLVKGTLSDSSGYFIFEKVAPAEYLISVSFIGYNDYFTEVMNVNQDVELPSFRLSTNNAQLDEVVVKAKKPFIELKADKIVMNVDASPVAAGNNALELLMKSPGVNVDQDENISLKGKQGVLILIDGKNTYLSNEELVKMLESMPANSIESIEIIHSPSSKYDAQGNAGVINIRLKKNENLGLNGNVGAGFGYGETPKGDASLNLNYRQEKFNVFGNLSYRHHERNQLLDIDRNIPFEGMLTIFDQDNKRHSYSDRFYFKTGADYYLSDKTTVGVLAPTSFGDWNEDGSSIASLFGDNSNPLDRVLANNAERENWQNFTYNFNVRHAIDDKGQEITFDADWSTYDNPERQTAENRYFSNEDTEVQAPYMFRTDNESMVDIKAIKADYTLPLNDKWNIEAGAKASLVTTDSELDFQVLEEDEWVQDFGRSNIFSYEETIYAAYANVSTSVLGLQVQAGLRSEYTQSDGFSETLNQRVTRDYLNFFPSVSLSHTIKEKHSLSYAFSRRIDRPNYGNLNPFVFFLDQFTFSKGNPFLQPQYTNNFTLNYGFQQYFFATFSYSRTTDAMTEVIEQNEAEAQIFQTVDNLDLFENYSVNLSTMIPWKDWVSTRLNVSTFYNYFDSPSAEGIIKQEQLTTNLYISNNFTINKFMQAELSAWYQSPMVYGMIEMQEMYSVNAGVSAQFFDGKANLKVSLDDVFNTLAWSADIQQGDIDAFIYQKNETRKINISLTYKFGNNKVKPARRRRTATSDEQNRVDGH
jgi:hypothetical protein